MGAMGQNLRGVVTMVVKTFEFEGEQLTVKQICTRVTGLSETTVREKLAKGMSSRTEMLSTPPKYRKPDADQHFVIGKADPRRARLTSSRVFK